MNAAFRPDLHHVRWQPGTCAEFPYFARINGQHWEIRVNDFPAEPMYTLLIDGQVSLDLDAWPSAWKRP